MPDYFYMWKLVPLDFLDLLRTYWPYELSELGEAYEGTADEKPRPWWVRNTTVGKRQSLHREPQQRFRSQSGQESAMPHLSTFAPA